jgi:rhodanese-related sulfurtransferase
MPSPTEITVPQLSRLIGLPGAPALIDARTSEEFKSEPFLLPAARHRDVQALSAWGNGYAGQSVIVYCSNGHEISQGAAAWLRHAGVDAQTLAGGFRAWRTAGQPVVRADRLPERDELGRTVWVTRARPKIIRIACPWLIRRFVDPDAVFLFVAPSEVLTVAERFRATPFDTGHGIWNDRGAGCTFDVMLEEFNLMNEPLSRLAPIVRGADTGQLGLTPQSAGLLAACLGYSRMHRDDLAQLGAAIPMFDAFYRWCRDGTDETHG